MRKHLRNEATTAVDSEIQIMNGIAIYLKEDVITTDVFEYWRSNKDKFKFLSKAAKHYMGIPATQTPSERLFSLTERIVTSERSSLLDEHVDEIAFLNYNCKPKK